MPINPKNVVWDDAPAQGGGMVQIAPASPLLGGQLAGQALDNANAAARLATAPYDAAKAKADAKRAQIEARNAAKTPIGGQPSVEERKAAAFLIRGLGAEGSYNAQHVGPRSYVGQKLADSAPDFLNMLPSAVGNSPRRQVADTNQDEFIAASLRQDSGAAIPPEEMNRQRRIYFPMPGDGPAAVKAKEQARQRALLGLYQSSGRVAPEAMKRFRNYIATMRGGQKSAPSGGNDVDAILRKHGVLPNGN